MSKINHFAHPFKYENKYGVDVNIKKTYQKRAKYAAIVSGIFTFGLAAAPVLYGMTAYYRWKCKNSQGKPSIILNDVLGNEGPSSSKNDLLELLKKPSNPEKYSQALAAVNASAKSASDSSFPNNPLKKHISEIQEYAQENNLVDILIAVSPQVKLIEDNGIILVEGRPSDLKDVIDNLPKSNKKTNPPLVLSLPQGSHPDDNENIKLLLNSGAFSGLHVACADGNLIISLGESLKQGSSLEDIVISSKAQLSYSATQELFEGLARSQVKHFSLKIPLEITPRIAAPIASAIKENSHLETFDLNCVFGHRDAFDAVYDAVLANKNLKAIKMGYIEPTDAGENFDYAQEKASLQRQREGLELF